MTSFLILLYLAGVLIVGLVFSWKKDRSTDDYFYGGKATGPVAFGSSLVLGNFARYAIILLPLAALQSFWIALVASVCVVVASYRIRFPHSANPDFADVCGNRVCRWFVSGVIFLSYVTIQIAGLLVLSQLLLGNALNQDYSFTVLMMVVFAGIYAVMGGFSAVAYTQVVQTGAFVGGLIVLAIIGAISPVDNVIPTLFSRSPVSIEGAILGLPVVSLWIWHYDRCSLQQVRAARDSGSLNRGLLFAGGIVALVAAAMYFGIWGGSSVQNSLGNFVLLLVCFAGLMASFAASFTSAAEMVSNEFFRSLKPQSSEQELVLVGRLATAAVVGLTIIMIPLVQSSGSRFLDLFLIVQACLFPPITAVFAARVIFNADSVAGILPSIVAGEIVGILRIVLHATGASAISSHPFISWFLSIDYFLFAFCLFCFSLLVLYGTGLVASARLRVNNRLT